MSILYFCGQAYFESVIKEGTSSSLCLELEMTDSGVGSTAPSEMLDIPDHDTEFTISQEDGILNLDPGLGTMTTSPKRSLSEIVVSTVPDPESSFLPTTPRCSAIVNGNTSAFESFDHATSNGSSDVVAMASTCASNVSFSATANEE